MSIIKRYKKEGGMEELVRLIETSAQKTQENILGSIQKEDPVFAEEVKKKLFYFEDLFAQADDVLAEIVSEISPKLWSFALLPYSEEQREHILKCAKHVQRVDIQDELEVVKEKANQSQILSAQKKIVGEARKLEQKGGFKLQKGADSPAPAPIKMSQPKTSGVNTLATNLTTQSKAPASPSSSTTKSATTPGNQVKILVQDSFTSLPLKHLVPNEKLKCDFYLFKDNKFVLCKKKESNFSETEIKRLQELNLNNIFIPLVHAKEYFKF